jgi:hypothetical protein
MVKELSVHQFLEKIEFIEAATGLDYHFGKGDLAVLQSPYLTITAGFEIGTNFNVVVQIRQRSFYYNEWSEKGSFVFPAQMWYLKPLSPSATRPAALIFYHKYHDQATNRYLAHFLRLEVGLFRMIFLDCEGENYPTLTNLLSSALDLE